MLNISSISKTGYVQLSLNCFFPSTKRKQEYYAKKFSSNKRQQVFSQTVQVFMHVEVRPMKEIIRIIVREVRWYLFLSFYSVVVISMGINFQANRAIVFHLKRLAPSNHFYLQYIRFYFVSSFLSMILAPLDDHDHISEWYLAYLNFTANRKSLCQMVFGDLLEAMAQYNG